MIGYRGCVLTEHSYSFVFVFFLEKLWLKDVSGMYTVLRQALHGALFMSYRHNFLVLNLSESNCYDKINKFH